MRWQKIVYMYQFVIQSLLDCLEILLEVIYLYTKRVLFFPELFVFAGLCMETFLSVQLYD